MNLTAFSEVIFWIGRRRPRFPAAMLRAMPASLLGAMRQAGLRATLRWATRSAFYREAFARAGSARPRRLEDLDGFFLTPDVLKSRPEVLLCGEPELAIESSGTSGHVTRVYLSRAELEYSARQGGLLYTLWGLTAGDRLLCTLDLGFGLGALLVERGVRYTPVFAMVVGRVDPLEIYERIAQYRFNAVVSDPFWLARLTEIAEERGRPAPMKLLMGGGEGVTERTRAALEHFWDAPLCMTYASTEAATVLGFECLERSGYHVNEFDFHLEVDRPDGEGYGELVLTTVNRRVMPLVRYLTGDVARWLEGPCRCGLPFRRISPLRGRLDEQVSCVLGNVHPAFFEPLFAEARGLDGDWQVALYERDLRPVFQFRVEIADDEQGRGDAIRAVLAALQRRHPQAWVAYRQRLMDIEFCFLPPGTLRQKRKLLRLVDERHCGPPGWAGAAVPAEPAV